MSIIKQHAADFVAKRLAPALPADDDKQTPVRGHPVFITQHATAICYHGCLAEWYSILQGVSLSGEQQRYIVAVIYHQLVVQVNQPRELRKTVKQYSQDTFIYRCC